jgi:hypothetical protein
VPAGWRLWLKDRPAASGAAPLQDSVDVPARGARPRARVEQYPVAVLNPGMWTDNHLQDEDYGFPPAPPRKDRPRLRLGMTITATALGLVLTALTVLLFVWMVDFGIEDLTGVLEETAGHLHVIDHGTGAAAPDHG